MTFWGSLAVVLVTAAIVFLSSTTVILAAVDGSDEDWSQQDPPELSGEPSQIFHKNEDFTTEQHNLRKLAYRSKVVACRKSGGKVRFKGKKWSCICPSGTHYKGTKCVKNTFQAKPPTLSLFCGGIAAIPCAPGFMCIDNPNDGCDPNKGGADCGDICVSGPACGGIGGLQCPLKGTVCVDDPNDSCDPLTGGKDCIGICVTLPSQCGGTDNVQCPSTYTCTDPIANCTFSDIGNNCTGVCELTCGGYSAVNVPCPVGLTCKDDPSRPGCLLAADCTGICLKP